MSKIRVHELAKQLDKSNKEILNFLGEKKIDIKSHMSTLEEDQVKLVKGAFIKKAVPETSAPKTESKAVNHETPKKKSNISQVFHPQNSKSGNRNSSGGNPGMNDKKATYTTENKAGRTNHMNSSKPNNIENRDRTASGGSTAGHRTTGAAQGTNRSQHSNQSRPANGQNANRTQSQGQNRSAGQSQNRSTGQSQNRPAGQSQNRSTGQSQNRPAGQSQNRSAGQSQNRPAGQSQNRPAGQGQNRSSNSNNRNTNGSNSQGYNKTGQGGNRPNQGGNRPNQGRRPNQGGNRPNQRNFRGRNQNQQQVQAAAVEKKDEIKTIILPEVMTIRELADKMKIPAAQIVKKLFLQGTMVTVNHEIDFAAAEEIALEYNCIAEPEVKIDVIAELLKEEDENSEDLKPRPPVVCVMGHVDHGKTSLLDAIRSTKVIDKEAGGITQHIGAYVVSIEGQKIAFLDTPGHEAFTAMRMRGANATDIAILVVAADDGVMPQTVEAINHAKAAGIEIIVAVNKIDKPSANLERVKQELSEYELIPEDWGGNTIFVPVSAHTQEGIQQLLEMILLTAEVCELKANPNRRARGLVIEGELDKGKGPVATILVQKGTLRVGDPIAAGSCFGKVRAMMDDKGRRVKEAGPSTPVEILGLSDVPNAGEIFVSPESEKETRNFAETFISEGRERLIDDTKAKMSLNDLFSQIQAGNLKELGIIVKADVQGSVEAVKQSLMKLSNEEVVVKIIHGGVGAINESDVTLAAASNAFIIGFNVRPDATAKAIADDEGVDMRLYRVIYDAITDVEAAMKGMLDPVFEEKVIGHAEIRQIFKASGVGTIAGSYVLDGLFQRGCSVRITRNDNIIFDGELASLKRFKDDVKEVKAGYECGLVFEKFNEVKELDLVEAYTMVEVPR
jgi:translation initiation factor IF-2